MQTTRTPRRPDSLVAQGFGDSRLSTPGSQPAVQRPLAPRSAFTLIELLIVIAIIGVLAGLLLGGVFGVFGTARVTQVTADINSLDKSIQDFKLRFGVEPPSFIVLYEDAPNWGTGPVPLRSRALVQRVWPDFNFGTAHDINLDGDTTDTFVLQSTEALVFFLGGNGMLSTSNPQPLGFSVNPQNPFTAGGQRVGPFIQFDTARLVDVDGDVTTPHTAMTGPIPGALGGPEYMDPIPGQIVPYLYFSSYDGAGYRPFGADGMAGNADDEIIEQSGADLIQGLYMVNDQNWPNTGGRPRAVAGEYINAKSFQIISPGQDFQFGAGGTYIRGQGLATFSGMDPYRTRDARKAEFDNITNFSGGLIGEQTIDKPAI